MRKKGQKLAAIMVSLAMAASMTACGGESNEEEASNNVTNTPKPTQSADGDNNEPSQGADPAVTTPEPTEVPEKYRDLGGMEIIIADWWSNETEEEPKTAQEEATREYRREIQEKYNFTIKQVRIGEWGDHQETFVLSTMANTPSGSLFMMDQGFIAKPLANNLFYDLATLESFDFSESKWNYAVIDEMTQGDHIYGMASGKPEPRGGVFWNKRLFEDAGLDPDLPYDLQASGEWTWEKFEELCGKLTRDTNNDSIPDTYAMASFSVDMFKALVASNGAEFIGINDDGTYYNATGSPEFLEALQFGVKLIEAGHEMPAPEGSDWDWFIPAFHDAKVAMTFAEQHKVSTWSDMDDNWGFVMAPAGPNGQSTTVFADNVVVMPSCFDAETANKIAFAYNLYTNPTPGYEDDDDWKTGYYDRFRDERAVDETLELMYEEGRGVVWYLPLVYGTSYGDIIYNVYGLYDTPAEKIETVSATWESLIEDANTK
ncbi:MAG: extracellular solute-binding protein [Lachnospiraceae bacterium]|nr:extracellular solute-binding protein [Lachnospiraceae bacterium]